MIESGGTQDQIILAADDVRESLASLVADRRGERSGDVYLKVGRRLARIETTR